MDVVWTSQRPGVFRAEGIFRELAFSPRGAFVAAHRIRSADPDFVRREAVHVMEASAQREVATLVGPAIVRGFAWVDESRLLVAREHEKGLRVSLHELPDGGEVASLDLPDAPQEDMQVRLSPDGRRALLHRKTMWWGGRSFVIELADLSLLRELHGFYSGALFNGDGTLLAECAPTLKLYALDPEREDQDLPWRQPEIPWRVSLRAWPSPHTLLGMRETDTRFSPVRLELTRDGVEVLDEPEGLSPFAPSLPSGVTSLAQCALCDGSGIGVVCAMKGRKLEYQRHERSGDGSTLKLARPLAPTERVTGAELYESEKGASVSLRGYDGLQLFVVSDEG